MHKYKPECKSDDKQEYVQALQGIVLERMDVSRELTDQELWDLIDAAVIEHRDPAASLNVRESARQQVFYALRGLDVLQELVEDPQITEIIEDCMGHVPYISDPTLEEVLATEQAVYEYIGQKWA